MGVLDKLWIPTSSRLHNRRVIQRCVVPTPDGPCGKPFFEGEEGKVGLHAAQCARANHEAIVAFRERQHPEIMRAWDPELERWMGRHKQAILEGRMKV